jgi:hypothetical protein
MNHDFKGAYGLALPSVLKAGYYPNTSFQRTLTRGGFGPLNSDR